VAGNAYLFGLGSHPFDMTSQKIWAYLTTRYGITDLYYAAQVSSLADVWNGMPFHEAVFPYGPGMAYYFGAIGHLHSCCLPASPGRQPGGHDQGFNFSTALVAHHLLLGASLRWAAGAGLVCRGLLLLNPAVIFDISIR
jgi:hypothetical protein